MARYRSRVLENFNEEELIQLKKITNTRKVTDNNIKGKMVLDFLRESKKEFLELGCGTNRIAVLIKGYVFKFALDSLGIRDNDNEFALSPNLFPYVIKTYETTGYISVCEYVEKILDIKEFNSNKMEIMRVLSSIVTKEYLIGDVGFTSKNFCNWGRRRGTGELCILDFAYMYKIDPLYMSCPKCQHDEIDYDKNFVHMVCIKCKTEISFLDMRRIALSYEEEEDYIQDAKNDAVILDKPVKELDSKGRDLQAKKEVVVKEKIFERGEGNFEMYRRGREDRVERPLGDSEISIFDLMGEDRIRIHAEDGDLEDYDFDTKITDTYLEEMRLEREKIARKESREVKTETKTVSQNQTKERIGESENHITYDSVIKDALESLEFSKEHGFLEFLTSDNLAVKEDEGFQTRKGNDEVRHAVKQEVEEGFNTVAVNDEIVHASTDVSEYTEVNAEHPDLEDLYKELDNIKDR